MIGRRTFEMINEFEFLFLCTLLCIHSAYWSRLNSFAAGGNYSRLRQQKS